jgi:argininosuccinate synthase
MPPASEESDLLKKFVENGDTIGICVSGGLDSKTVALRLKQAGVKVKCFTADIGQPDEEDINDIPKKMAPCGVETVIVDLKKDIAEGAFEAIAAQAMYDGGYWQSTGIGRYVTVRGLLSAMKKHGVTVLAHGATGRGNDQVRFERYVNVLDPNFKVYAPWRDPTLLKAFPGRTQMLAYLQENGIQHTIVSTSKRRYSTDANVLGLSNEAEDLESLETAMTIVNPVMGVWPQDAPAAQEDVTLRFEKGRCVAINGKKMEPFEILQEAAKIAGRNGIGISHALENRILGTKSRGVYEQPAMELLGKAITYVYQAVLDRRSTSLFKELSKHVADQIYDGRYFDPSTRAALTAIWQLAEPADGTLKLGLFKGNIWFLSLTECPHSIYFEADASMEASDGLNPVSSQGYLEVSSVEAKAMAKSGLIDATCVWSKRRKL